jgi:hypothetical protein
MLSRLMGSTSSPFRRARLRALYRKQYLTPTMILRGSVYLDDAGRITAHHRFVKTTPKPKATKKSKGELPPPPLPVDAADEVALGAADVGLWTRVVELAEVVDGGAWLVACWAARSTT